MNVGIFCEFSGIVREAFRARGHNAWSIDLEPTEIPGQHIQGDCFEYLEGYRGCALKKNAPCILEENGICRYRPSSNENECSFMEFIQWDMIIVFPPCTDLSGAGARYWREKQADGRQRKAFELIKALWAAPVEKICIENPTGWLNSHWKKPTQIINPCDFGDPYLKRTCLWIRGLLPLMPQNKVEPKAHWLSSSCRGGKLKDGTRRKSKLPMGNAWEPPKIRSKTFPGIARAMAEQWG